MSSDIAVLCFLHPASAEKKERILSLLAKHKPYYQLPSSKCTTWTYFTPSNRKGAPKQPLHSTTSSDQSLILGGMEIYTDPKALGAQLDADFKDFQATVKQESLYAPGASEEVIVWKPVAGFIARDGNRAAAPFGKTTTVMLARFAVKEGAQGARERLVEILGKFAEWVKANEPGVLTYSVMTRTKNPLEVLMFERYRDLDSFKAHGSSKEFRTMFKSTGPYLNGKGTRLCEWTELDNAFVGNVVGGPTDSKL